jgi:hypothetical protein
MFRRGQRFESGAASVRVCHDGYALSVGELVVFLDRRGAQDVVGALTYALLATVPIEPPELPDDEAPKRRRRKP